MKREYDTRKAYKVGDIFAIANRYWQVTSATPHGKKGLTRAVVVSIVLKAGLRVTFRGTEKHGTIVSVNPDSSFLLRIAPDAFPEQSWGYDLNGVILDGIK